MTEIYHSLGQHVTIDTVLEEGLKSRQRLVEERKLEPTPDFLLPCQMEAIYFRWWDPAFARSLDTSWVSIEVDPEKTRVFNAEFRYDINNASYRASERSLSELIERKKRGEAMKGTVPGKFVVYHPLTAEPTFVNVDDARVSDCHWIYSNEITVYESVILPTYFKNYQRGK